MQKEFDMLIDSIVFKHELEEWVDASEAVDHGALAGLSDDDHTQYFLVDGTRALTDYVDIAEQTIPGNPAADTLRLYVEDIHGFPFFSFRDASGMIRKLVRDSVFVGYNDTGSTIVANRAVYAAGTQVDVPKIALAKADSINTMPCIGITTESIADGAYGRVMQVGLLENINTSPLSVGDTIFVSATIAGAGTATAPLYPNIRQEIATVLVDSATVGALQVVARSMTNEGLLDHGGMLGLADDDHTQYHTDARGDARYYTQAQVDTHMADTTTHGTSGDVVGTSDAQTLTNKTLQLDDEPITMTVYNGTGGALALGDLCYISGDQAGTPSVTKAKADAAATSSKMLVVINGTINNAASGLAVIYGWVTGLSGLTAAAIQYVSDGTAGAMTETIPTDAGDIVRIVGYAMSTTELFFNPDSTYLEVA
jgi:hypothetical protein